jgi:hypothetical protein
MRDSMSHLSRDRYLYKGTYTNFQRGDLEALVQETENKETEHSRMTGVGLTLDIGELPVGMDMVPKTSNNATVEVPGRPKHRKAP